MRKSILKWIPALLILLFLGYWFFADTVLNRPPEKTVISERKYYSVLETDGQYYLRIHYPEKITPDYISSNIPESRIEPNFKSLSQMKEIILDGRLHQWHLDYIWDACRYDPQYDLLITDLTAVYEPVVDERLSVSRVYWNGLDYKVIYNMTHKQGAISFTCYGSKESFDKVYERDYETLLQRIQNDLVSTEELPQENATVYIFYRDMFEQTLSKAKVFNFSTASRQLTVLEKYHDSSDPMPEDIRFYGCENGVYFSGYLSQAYIEQNGEHLPAILNELHISSEPIP